MATGDVPAVPPPHLTTDSTWDGHKLGALGQQGFPSTPIRPQLSTNQFVGYLQEQLLHATLEPTDPANQNITTECNEH